MKERTRIAGLVLLASGASWARPGGGSSYRSSSSRSSSSSSYRSSGSSYRSSSSSSSYRSSSSSYRSSGPSGGSYSGGGGDSGGFLPVFILIVILVLVFMILMNSTQQQTGFIRNSNESHSETTPSDLGSRLQLGCLSTILILLVLPHLFSWLAPFIPVAVVGGMGWLVWRSQNPAQTARTSSVLRVANANLKELFETDPNFSLPIFREFAVLLYSQAMLERRSQFPTAGPYLDSLPANGLASRSQARAVRDVVVGCCNLKVAQVVSGRLQLRVSFESNYLEEDANGRLQAFIANEDWVFSRRIGNLTRRPEGVRKLGCPSCGYAGEFTSSGACPQCQNTNRQGQLDWIVTRIEVRSLEPFRPYSASGGGVEAGTNAPTVVHRDVVIRLKELQARHPDFRLADFQKRVQDIFMAINEAWTRRNWAAARPFETDALFRTHRYWIEDHLQRGLVNRLGEIRLTSLQISNVVLDAFYESITVRLFASMIDYTVEEKTNKVVSGDPKTARSFTEYWTFVRSVGARKRRVENSHQCPSCGAALDKVNQTGVCEYCDTLITCGDFDWVLSNIEQDEVYQLSI